MTSKNNKSDALIRDIAKLFVSYPMAAWRPLIDELEKGSDLQIKIASAISNVMEVVPKPRRLDAARSARKKSPLRTSKATYQTQPTFVPERAEALSLLSDELANRQTLPRLPDIRRFYLEAGGKLELPKDRRSACLLLLSHLNEVSDETFSRALVSIREGADDAGAMDAYARWFRLIRPAESIEQQLESETKALVPDTPQSKSPSKKKPL